MQPSKETEQKPVTRLAIGVEGGFNVGPDGQGCTVETECKYSLVELPSWSMRELDVRTENSPADQKTVALQKCRVKVLGVMNSSSSLSENMLRVVEAVINAESAATTSAVEQFAAWEGDIRAVTRCANC